MNSGKLVALLLLSVGAAFAQQGPGITWLSWERSKPTGPVEVYDSRKPAERYRLAASNRTVSVFRAYLVDSLVVVIGEMGGVIGEIVTIIDGRTKNERIEFLCNDAQPSDDGLRIAFRHFYPHFGTAELSDRVDVLDLSQRLPEVLPSDEFHVPTAEVGANVYPPIEPESGQRHRVQNFVWSTDASSLFFLDRVERILPAAIEGLALCIVRVDQVASPARRVVKKCLDPGELGDSMSRPLRPKDFVRNGNGRLVLTLAVEGQNAPSSTPGIFIVDPVTLELSRAEEKRVQNSLAIPWAAQKQQIITFSTLPRIAGLKPYENVLIAVRLLIGEDGSVEAAELGGSLPDELFQEITNTISKWTFRGIILNGVPTKVTTAFETELANLEDKDWPSKNR